MKTILTLSLLTLSVACFGQTSDLAFHTAAKQYIAEKTSEAKKTLDDAIVKYPSDERLRKLRDKIKEDEKQKEKEKEKQDQEKQEKENQKKDQDNKDQDQKNQKEKGEGEEKEDKDAEKKKDQEEKEGEGKESEKQQDAPPSLKQKLDQMNMSEEKAKMILDALKNQEVQYLQQNKRKATQSKDSSKPDW